MNREPTRTRKFLVWLLMLVFLMACALPSASTPIAAPVQQPLEAVSLETIIAQTVVAAQTSTALNMPTATPTQTATQTLISTSTTIPTVTFIVLTFAPTYTVNVPTLTQVISTSIPQSQGQGGGGAAAESTLSDKDQRATLYPKIPIEWDCRVTSKSPPKGTIIKQKKSFYLTWTIVNHGTKTWTNNTIDFIYTGGYVQDGRPIQDLPLMVAPGNSITLKVPMTAPKAPGTYNSYWSLKVGQLRFCQMKGTFIVQ